MTGVQTCALPISQDLAFGVGLRVTDAHVHQEAVELRLWQREGALLLDRVLRRHHQEQRRQRIGLAADGDLALAHCLEQGRLHLRSEEHTSELQSLMRLSYAVFCLKKNKKPTN